ncbi:glycosyltransferase [Pseudomonas sp. 3A(2025)]
MIATQTSPSLPAQLDPTYQASSTASVTPKKTSSDIELDLTYYRTNYPDLAHLDDDALESHWHQFGFYEQRYASAAHAQGENELTNELLDSPASLTPEKTSAQDIELDLIYYRARYHDLAHLDDEALEYHWHQFGFHEKRYASAAHAEREAERANTLLDSHDTTSVASKRSNANRVELKFYLTLYPDLVLANVTTQAMADAHFKNYGEEEGRVPSLSAWAKKNNVPSNLIPAGFSLSEVMKRNAECGMEVEPQGILETLLGWNVAPIALAETPEKTQTAFFKLGKYYLAHGQRVQGRHLLEAALSFGPLAQALELLGNSYLDEGHVSIALHYYNATAALSNTLKWTAINRARCLTKLHRLDEAFDVLVSGIASNPNFRQQYDELERLAEQMWSSLHAELLAWVDTGSREQLIEKARLFATRLHQAYLPKFGRNPSAVSSNEAALQNPTLPPLGHINTDRILIVGDFHIAQCERYRINQKIEQLVAFDKEVTAINWTELETHQNDLAIHDVVIFYRVPAVPKVIKAIAQVNATGKLSLYEIDDLLFVPEYPPAIETYGGYVSLDAYRNLTRGMALFNAAARLCRQGIASTEPLREQLAELVQEQRCWLHRNGLDHLNQFRVQNKSQKQTIDIFYGSGTQAHNSDFIEQALPAIERVLEEVPRARLVVVGYLRLPQAFLTRFAKQYSQLPPVKSVQGYWSLLEQADINIAVLHDDLINACKSELKWFEAACFGIPSVLSSTANYRDVVRDGEDAFLATTSEEWYSSLRQLAGSQELRQRMGQAAMQRAKDDYSLQTLGGKLIEQLESASASAQPRKPKLALVNVFFPPQSIGGATRVVADNFSALRKHHADELDVCVFTADAEHRSAHQMTVYNHQDCRVYQVTTLWREHMDWHPRDPEMYRLFTEFLEVERPDVIHFHCIQRLTASIVEAAKDFGIPYIVTAHDAWWISDFQFLVDHNDKVYAEGHPDPYQLIELAPNMTLADSIERRRDLKELLNSAEKRLTVSNAFANIYRANGIRDIEVTPNGISEYLPWSPKDTSHTENVVCGHIGSMSEHKGYHLLKDAVLESQPKNLEFLIVDHSKEEGYEHRSFWGKVPVKFIGRVDQDKIVDLYRQIDVLFAPSIWPESFGLVTREAVACGCWVVASSLGGIGEDIVNGENGYVINPTEDMLIKALNYINLSPEKHKASSTTAVKRTATEQTETLKGLYMELTSEVIEAGAEV